MSNQYGIAVVVPCYNEARRLNTEAFIKYISSHPDVRVVFVDDGSTDNTRELLCVIASAHPGRAIIEYLPRNCGKAEAVRLGILSAMKEGALFTGYLDADLAAPLTTIDQLHKELLAQPEAVLAMGARVRMLGKKVERTATRHYLGRVFATAVSLALGVTVYDTQCGAKLLRNVPLTRKVFELPFRSRWVFDVELLLRIESGKCMNRSAVFGVSVIEVPLDEWREVDGSKIRLWHLFGAGWHLLWLFCRRIAWQRTSSRA